MDEGVGSGAGDPSVDRFLAGEADVVAETIRLIRAAVHSRGFYIPAEERAEVAQEAMMQLWRHLSDSNRERPRSFAAFARAIAYRRCVDWMRRHTESEPVDESLPTATDSPEDSLLERERVAIGEQVLASLRDSCRDLIRRYVHEGLTFREIAESQGRLEKTVRNQMYKCLGQARDKVERMRRRSRVGPGILDRGR